jgi:hypothetical protein
MSHLELETRPLGISGCPRSGMVNDLRYRRPMRDSDVRAAVTGWLRGKHADDPTTRIVQEMGVWNGSVRIDVAVINGELHGFELKSDRDTLDRLEAQAEIYSQVFDRVTLVAGKRHVEKATAKIPDWWGIASATMVESGPPRLRPIRRAERNPNLDMMQMARLLWRPEALQILDRHGYSRGFKSKPVEILRCRLVQSLAPRELALEIRTALKSRDGWLGQPVSNEGQVTAGRDACPESAGAGSLGACRDLFDPTVTPAAD